MIYPLPAFLEPELLELEFVLGVLFLCPESLRGALTFGSDFPRDSE